MKLTNYFGHPRGCHRSSITAFVLVAAALVSCAPSTVHAASGSYWVVYSGDAPDSCLVPDGDMVDDSCCETNLTTPFHIRPTFTTTCFVIRGLLGENGGSVMSYLGCDETAAEDGTVEPVYGEACYNGGANGGYIPPNVTGPEDTNATSNAECGCQFTVTGNGCHKIRDFSVLPGFASDPRQVFLYMDETCEQKTMPTGTTDDSSNPDDDDSASARHHDMAAPLVLTSILTFALGVIASY